MLTQLAPRITVLMPCFNAGRFLEPSIRSIQAQTFRDWELIIVDDCSTDGSVDVAQALADAEPRVHVVRNAQNKGQTLCLNQGLALARGEWTARQDADDLSHPLRLARQFERVTAEPDLALLGTCGRMVDETDRLVGLLDMPLTPAEISWTAPFLNPFIHTGVLFRTALVRDSFGGYNENFRIAQDYELWTRLAAVHPVANLPQRLVCYRHLATSLSKTGCSTAFEEAARVSAREARRVFGRRLRPAEEAILASFREGLQPSERRAFWTLYDEFRSRHGGKLSRLAALHHLKAAGALAAARSPSALLEIVSALREDLPTSLHWLAERLRG